jgi:hypothetical protein
MLRHFAFFILFLCLSTIFANSQARTGPSLTLQTQPTLVAAPDTGSSSEQLQREQVARVFTERQRQLRIDTAKLLALSTELKQVVDRTDINILSMEVVKKAQEIQKLAKSVQEKMKHGY